MISCQIKKLSCKVYELFDGSKTLIADNDDPFYKFLVISYPQPGTIHKTAVELWNEEPKVQKVSTIREVKLSLDDINSVVTYVLIRNKAETILNDWRKTI